ncbi:type VII secretion protein EssB [Bacillus marasmi]|uniref:type VII secretion protein EssB n=1 Tax=Bacillus marasmi TaxID=1926279 RepID=UPI0011C6FBF2|nr:type VII secretion protein EssB [Bacillus marasmi]
MKERTLKMESLTFQFLVYPDLWQLKLPKSQTHVNDIQHLAMMNVPSELFLPAVIEEEEDLVVFSFLVDQRAKTWEDVRKLNRSDKLRLLCNIARFKKCLTSRITFFLHPDNLVFDDNLMPTLAYRGIRDLVPPFEMNEEKFLQQYKALIIALFSKKYTFEELYYGSLKNVKESEFEKQIAELEDFDSLFSYLRTSYIKEISEHEKTMQFVPKKRFRLYKGLAFSMIALAVLLAVPLGYLGFVKIPEQSQLLNANHAFLSADYDNVIKELEGHDPKKLTKDSKYILAYSYIQSEKLSKDQKASILKNVHLKSNSNYLLYWIYNGRGDLEQSVDLAKYLDDPNLIMYGLIEQIEQVKKDPKLSGAERDEKMESYMDQYEDYKEKYGLDSKTINPK